MMSRSWGLPDLDDSVRLFSKQTLTATTDSRILAVPTQFDVGDSPNPANNLLMPRIADVNVAITAIDLSGGAVVLELYGSQHSNGSSPVLLAHETPVSKGQYALSLSADQLAAQALLFYFVKATVPSMSSVEIEASVGESNCG